MRDQLVWNLRPRLPRKITSWQPFFPEISAILNVKTLKINGPEVTRNRATVSLFVFMWSWGERVWAEGHDGNGIGFNSNLLKENNRLIWKKQDLRRAKQNFLAQQKVSDPNISGCFIWVFKIFNASHRKLHFLQLLVPRHKRSDFPLRRSRMFQSQFASKAWKGLNA